MNATLHRNKSGDNAEAYGDNATNACRNQSIIITTFISLLHCGKPVHSPKIYIQVCNSVTVILQVRSEQSAVDPPAFQPASPNLLIILMV